MRLSEWAEAYLRHRDLFEQKIQEIRTKERTGFEELFIVEKQGSKRCLVTPHLGSVVAQEASLIVVSATEDNFADLLTHWQELSARPGLKVIFANLRNNEKWVIIPHNHAQIAEKASLKQGLRTMFEAVL